jgi:CRISPR/Cas system-associated exonuclease Cas4 (RecB family)
MLIEKINRALIKKRAEEPNRDYIGASGIGHPCLRRVWYSYHLKKQEPFSDKLLMTFEMGHYLERMILDLLDKSGLKTIYFDEVETKPIHGHVDAIAVDEHGELYIIEIKSTCNTQFNAFKLKGLHAWKMQYYAQVQAYMGIKKIAKAILIAINKDTAELHEELVTFDPLYYEELLNRANEVIYSEEPPDRINKNPCFFICKMCPFSNICHEDA